MSARDKNRIRAASFEDTFAIGINSALVDYKLAWAVNKRLSIDFVRQEDIVAEGSIFSFFYYSAGENCYVYNLVSVFSQHKTLFNFSPRLDYLMVIRNGIMPQRVDTIIKNLREIEGVGYAFLLDVNKGKSIKQVLETIELHEIYLLEQNKKRNSLEQLRQKVLRQRETTATERQIFSY